MRTYWDLSEKERAALAREDVEKFIDAELMTKGVLKVQPLVLEPAPLVPEPTTTAFEIRRRGYGQHPYALLFASAEDAHACLALRPLLVDGEYVDGKILNALRPLDDAEVVAVKLHTAAERDAHKVDMLRKAEVENENDKRQRAHDEQVRKQDEVLRGMWTDWYDCQRKAHDMQRVVDTFNDYVRIAGGARDVAGVFLLKVFAADVIAEAAEWMGGEIPIGIAPQPASQPKADGDALDPGF